MHAYARFLWEHHNTKECVNFDLWTLNSQVTSVERTDAWNASDRRHRPSSSHLLRRRPRSLQRPPPAYSCATEPTSAWCSWSRWRGRSHRRRATAMPPRWASVRRSTGVSAAGLARSWTPAGTGLDWSAADSTRRRGVSGTVRLAANDGSTVTAERRNSWDRWAGDSVETVSALWFGTYAVFDHHCGSRRKTWSCYGRASPDVASCHSPLVDLHICIQQHRVLVSSRQANCAPAPNQSFLAAAPNANFINFSLVILMTKFNRSMAMDGHRWRWTDIEKIRASVGVYQCRSS